MTERAQSLTTQARGSTDELAQQLALARQRLADSKIVLARAMCVSVLPYHGAANPAAEPLEAEAAMDGGHRTFAAVTELIEQIEDAASRDAGLAARLIEDIILAIQVVAEPSLLMGILLEGMAETVLERLSEEERRETAIALCTLLWDRINQGATE